MDVDARLDVGPHSAAMVRALGLLYLTGTSVAAASQLLPHSPATDQTAVWILIAIAVAMVPVIFTQYGRLPPSAISAIVAIATVLITAVVYFNHEVTSPFAYFYLYVTPYTAIFLSARHAAAHVAFAAVSYGIAIALLAADDHGAPGDADVTQWLAVTVAIAVTVLLARALTSALRENLAAIEQERRRRAMEINDDVVQRLVLARQSFAAHDQQAGEAAVDAALDRARHIMAELIGPGGATPGSLRRETAASD